MTVSNNNHNNNRPSLADRLMDPSRPVFLLGDVPPAAGTAPGKRLEIAQKFARRSRTLATDGFIVYDIQDEPGRAADIARPFPFRQLSDSTDYAQLLRNTARQECLVYKCVADAEFDAWLDKTARTTTPVNLVGRATSNADYVGPTLPQALEKVAQRNIPFGNVCIAERHTLEAAAARGKEYPTEHLNMMRKQKAGAAWFVSQAVYDAEPTIRLLRDYAATCRQEHVAPRRVVLTFCPVSRLKTMQFIQWLGVRVPDQIQDEILQAKHPVEQSIQILCQHLETILQATAGLGVPLGINCESVSIFKAEIDGVHELFRRLQGILLDARGSPWHVTWMQAEESLAMKCGSIQQQKEEKGILIQANHGGDLTPMQATVVGIILGGVAMAVGFTMGSRAQLR